MEGNIKAHMRMTRNMVSEFSYLKMVEFIKDNGKMENNMAEAYTRKKK